MKKLELNNEEVSLLFFMAGYSSGQVSRSPSLAKAYETFMDKMCSVEER